MKNTELRIGNYLNTKDGKLAIVEKITKDDYIAYSGMITKLPLSPIPLTEEWLLKFGFEDIGFGFFRKYTSEKYYILTHLKQGYSEICVNSICGGQSSTKNVHQLQNLYFALTGEELKKA